MSIAWSEIEAPVRSSNVLSWLRCLAIILLLLATSAGTTGATIAFKPLVSYPVGTNPVAVAIGDFNGDGKPDLAVVNHGDPTANNGSVSILFGNGDGTFQKATNVAIGKNCTSVIAGDLDGDGNDDLALVRPGDASINDSGDITIFLGNGDGTFRQAQVLTPGKNPSPSRRAILAADLNRDQRLDLVVANSGDHTFSVLLGNGDGTFQRPATYPEATSPASVFVLDLAGNGAKDLVVSRILSVDLWLANGDGTFRQGPSLSGGGVATGDFNGDRKYDLVVQPFHLCIFHPCSPVYPNLQLGNGDGTFQSAISIGQPADAAADFDGDGKLDLVGANSSNGSAEALIFQGNGDGTFQQPVHFAAGTATTILIASTADVTGDGASDVVLLSFDSAGNANTVAVLVNTGTDFSISASALNPRTLNPGQSATSTISLARMSSFDNPVSLACTVQPVQAGSPTCSINPNSVTFDSSGNATTQLTVTAGAVAASLSRSPARQNHLPGQLAWLPVAGFAAIGAGFGRGATRKKRLLLLMSAFLLTGLILETACGGGSSRPKFQSYSVTVIGTSGSVQHSVTVTLKVQ